MLSLIIGSCLITRLHFFFTINKFIEIIVISIFFVSFPKSELRILYLGKTYFQFYFGTVFTHNVDLGVCRFFLLYKNAVFQFFVYFVGGFWATHLYIFLLIFWKDFKIFFLTFSNILVVWIGLFTVYSSISKITIICRVGLYLFM